MLQLQRLGTFIGVALPFSVGANTLLYVEMSRQPRLHPDDRYGEKVAFQFAVGIAKG